MLKFFLFLLFLVHTKCDDTQCTINNKKSLHIVSDKFIGISIDPSVLLTGFNIGDTTAKLASFMSPAYLRLAGPSTKYIKFCEDERNVTNIASDTPPKSLVITPSTWAASNAWLSNSNLTLVFALNDHDRVNGGWNPKSMFPLFDLSDKLNIACHFQLGYDCSNKSVAQYKDDLVTLRHVLYAFPEKKVSWDIIGSDISRLPLHTPEERKSFLDDLGNVADAVMWEPRKEKLQNFPIKDSYRNFYSPRKNRVPIWLVVPKDNRPVTFSSALDWAKQVGYAATQGYKVILRQPRLHELFADTPIFWTSVLHKSLMGQNVLDLKVNGIGDDNVHIFAHCTKKQNSYPKSGSVTIFVVNDNFESNDVTVKLPNVQKYTEVQSYILTSTGAHSKVTYCNGQKLLIQNTNDPMTIFIPKLRRAQTPKNLVITTPPKSIGFFVLPGVRFPVCVEDEDETSSIMGEIRRDQNIKFPNDASLEFTTLSTIQANNLRDIYNEMKKELKSDEKFYQKLKKKNDGVNDWNKSSDEKEDIPKSTNKNGIRFLRNQFVERMKSMDKQKSLDVRRPSISRLIKIVEKQKISENESPAEIKSITNNNLDEILKVAEDSLKTSENLAKMEDTIIKNRTKRSFVEKLKEMRNARKEKNAEFMKKLKLKGLKRPKRDINMDLLKKEEDKEITKMRKYESESNSKESLAKILEPPKEIKKIYDDIAKFVENSRKKVAKLQKIDLDTLIHPKKETTPKTSIISPDLDGDTVEQNSDESEEKVPAEEDVPKPELHENFKKYMKEHLKPFKKNEETNLYEEDTSKEGEKLKDDVDVLLADDIPIYDKEKEEIPKNVKNLEEYFRDAQRLDRLYGQSNSHYGLLDSLEYGTHSLRYKRDNDEKTISHFDTIDQLIKRYMESENYRNPNAIDSKAGKKSYNNFQYMLIGSSIDPSFFLNLNKKLEQNTEIEARNKKVAKESDEDSVLQTLNNLNLSTPEENEEIVKVEIPILRRKRTICNLESNDHYDSSNYIRKKKNASRGTGKSGARRNKAKNRITKNKHRNRRNIVMDNFLHSKEEANENNLEDDSPDLNLFSSEELDNAIIKEHKPEKPKIKVAHTKTIETSALTSKDIEGSTDATTTENQNSTDNNNSFTTVTSEFISGTGGTDFISVQIKEPSFLEHVLEYIKGAYNNLKVQLTKYF